MSSIADKTDDQLVGECLACERTVRWSNKESEREWARSRISAIHDEQRRRITTKFNNESEADRE